MKQKFKKIRKKLTIALSGIILLSAATVMIWRSFTYTYDEMLRCTTVVECRSYYTISLDRKPILYFSRLNADSTLAEITTNVDSARNNIIYSAGFWVNKMPIFPSCYGHIATAFEGKDEVVKINYAYALRIMSIEAKRLKVMKDSLKSESGELKYYLSVHGVQDEGYNMIAKYAAKVNAELKNVDSVLNIIHKKEDLSKIAVKHISEYSAIYYDSNNKLRRVKCVMKAASFKKQSCLLQTVDKTTPDGVCAIFIKPWACVIPKKILAISYAGLGSKEFESPKAKANIVAGNYKLLKGHDMPTLFVADGSPVFSHRGRLIGMTSGKKVINRKRIVLLFDKEK